MRKRRISKSVGDHARGSHPRSRSFAGRESRKLAIISVDEFKQILLRYSSRQVKTGKQFALVSIELANYETLLAYAKEDEMIHLLNSLRMIAADAARDADRLSVVSPAMLLLLLPETTLAGAEQAVTRLREALSAHLRPVAQINAVLTFRISASSAEVCDLQDLLVGVGFYLNEHGDLRIASETRAVYKLGSLESWLDRYERVDNWKPITTESLTASALGAAAVDRWTTSRVQMIKVDLNQGGDNTIVVANLVQRARSLQQMGSASVQKSLDFYLEQNREFYLVVETLETVPLFAHSGELSEDELLLACLDLVGVLIQSHTLVPYMALPYNNLYFMFDTCARKLKLTDFQLYYMLNASFSEACDESISVLGRFMQALAGEKTSLMSNALRQIGALLVLPKRPDALSTLHKTRAYLRRLEERLQESPTVSIENLKGDGANA